MMSGKEQTSNKEARTKDPSYTERNPTPNKIVMGKKELWSITMSCGSGVAEE